MMSLKIIQLIVLGATFGCCWGQKTEMSKYGRYIGDLARDVSGQVYAVSDEVLFIKGFVYGGTGPDAFFWTGNSSRPSPIQGTIIPYPADYQGKEPPVLGRYDNKDVLLKLPLGVKVRDLRWLSVWCRRFAVDFGSVLFPADLDPPKPRILSEFKRLAHGLRSGSVTILDAKTIYIPNLHYDGAAPDAFFWVGSGTEPNAQGIKVPNELGDFNVLRGYQGEDIEIQLPGDLTVHDISWLSLWCIRFKENFGHVMIPKDLDVPPALGQNQLTTTKSPSEVDSTDATAGGGQGHEFDSCIQLLNGRMQVQWEAILEGVIIRLSARMDENEYMSFGISGAEGKTQMIGADVTVAYYNSDDNKFYADDYILNAKAQCDGSNGACPDSRIGGRNDVSMLYGQRVNGVTTVAYQRSLDAKEAKFDQVIPPVGRVNVIAAIGPLNSRKEANYHSTDRTGSQEDHRIDFTSRGVNQCPTLLAPEDKSEAHGPLPSPTTSTENAIQPWKPNVIFGKTELRARIGPTGGKRGYTAITGQPSWGLAWYINDLLIPEIYVERGETYTFLVEGGNDPLNSARWHPLYITDSLQGGYGQKTDAQQREQRVFAGVEFDPSGFPFPTAAGSLCEWKHKTVDKWAESETFEDYTKTLILECESGREQPANLTWTVPLDAPKTLYYQCYTHNSLGWKINVEDRGFQPPVPQSAASSPIGSRFSLLAVLLLPLSVLFL
ncbi:protein Skeletor, isoforms B/C-like isoform X2 [Daphnia pulex]|uniref:protein Skeletor, isoforms B/C-like isoform X2 n=1 Tax=Daphnia pulex TaxID=6669 RepID=UPI001EDFB8B0|nr:protein Skeletor, isoforms B/C-like isoform X2 [Daphnia pulex]